MESNEITMFMDAKLDIHGKRPDSLKFKSWSRCSVKIEAIKCVPSFLRITLTRNAQTGAAHEGMLTTLDCAVLDEVAPESVLTVSINVPGVSVSPSESRTKQHSYGLFWKQNRRNCYIYFAIEPESSYKRHMKWIKKSIKNLELHRQIFLEQRQNSRGPGVDKTAGLLKNLLTEQQEAKSKELNSAKNSEMALGPLPKIPDLFDSNSSTWSAKNFSRVSEIYEEIFDNEIDLQQHSPMSRRVSRRFSRTSIASGIYEEMKPTTGNFNAIDEEVVEHMPPPLPPLPPPRKRINTFDSSAGAICEIPRSNTNPESEMAKKKKYKIMLDNLFGGINRTKRAESVSETATCSVEDIVNEAMYANGDVAVAAKRQKKPTKINTPTSQSISKSKRNSFSSPDLSKINFLETFDEDRVASLLLQNSFASDIDELCVSRASLDESSIHPDLLPGALLSKFKTDSAESINISQQIPATFNFSACNTSSINLVGASGATLLQNTLKNNIIIDDLTGYCIMAPIKKKPWADNATGSQKSTSSGYSTVSYCSSTTSSSSGTNSTEENSKELTRAKQGLCKVTKEIIPTGIPEESTIYENMLCGDVLNLSTIAADAEIHGNLYENLIAAKVAQELVSNKDDLQPKMSTSTPTGIDIIIESPVINEPEKETENYYQTPRKSIISVDDKIPSYYPNDCDTNKLRRHSHSPIKTTPTSSFGTCEKSSSGGLRQLVRAKVRRDRKENFFVMSQQKTSEQKQSSKITNASDVKSKSSNKSKKSAATHKISDQIYVVSHDGGKKKNLNNNNNLIDPQTKLQNELLQLAALQKIDFKFDDSDKSPLSTIHKEEVEICLTENCLTAKESASRILHKYATLALAATSPSSSSTKNLNAVTTPSHYLQQSQQSNTQEKRITLTASGSKQETHSVSPTVEVGATRKFGSLPRFTKIDFSPLRLKINNVLQRNQPQPEL